jgi:UDP-N-acetylglucosamine 2-epimerase (non-hydrolysing)
VNAQGPILLVTQHRRENFGVPLMKVLESLKIISKERIEILFPVHPNPSVKDVVHGTLSGFSNIHLIDPVDYQSMVYLLSNSKIILTDSGGIQEEACALGIPVLVTRDTTERMEGVESGGIKLIGHNSEVIIETVINLLKNQSEYDRMKNAKNPFGDGSSSIQISRLVTNFLFSERK